MVAQAIKLLINGHPYDDLARDIPFLIDKVNEEPDNRQAVEDLRGIAVSALDRYRRLADQYQLWIDAKVDNARRKDLYKVVLDF